MVEESVDVPELTRPTQQPTPSQKTAQIQPKLFAGAKIRMKYVIKASAIVLLFWFVQFLYMFYVAVPGQLDRSIILSAAYSGMTLIGISLLVGPLLNMNSKLNFIAHRRTVGVWGFTIIIAHVAWAIIYYNITIQSYLQDLNPFTNAIIFGALAFVLYIPTYFTSTDWAMVKLGVKNWKSIQRLVYLAFLLSTVHFIRINTSLTWNLSKVLLVAVTVIAYVLELIAYGRYMSLPKRRTIGNMLYGGALIVFGIILLYFAFK